MLRARSMGWVDMVMESRHSAALCEVIAASGVFQPEQDEGTSFMAWNAGIGATSVARELRARLRVYDDWLPAADIGAVAMDQRVAPFDQDAEAVANTVTEWLDRVRPYVADSFEWSEQHKTLEELACILDRLPPAMNMEFWHSNGDFPRAFVPILLSGESADVSAFLEQAPAAFLRPHAGDGRKWAAISGLIQMTESKALLRMSRQFRLTPIDVPSWVCGPSRDAAHQVRVRMATYDRQLEETAKRIGDCSNELNMAGIRWLIERQVWLEHALEKSNRGERFWHVGGWVPQHRFAELSGQLKQSGHPCLIRFDDGAGHGLAPSVLENPRWAERFELFVRGFGTPGTNEIDPSVVLALVTPLMFGYMFGDVGQGLLLVLAGWLLGARMPWIRLLVPAGVSSMAFGLLYGSVFSMEHIIPALWLHPLDRPLVVLAVPLLFGMLLMLLSLLFGMLQARWEHTLSEWLHREIPVLLCYLALPAALLDSKVALVLVLLAVSVLTLTPHSRETGLINRLLTLPTALLQLLEHWLQLVINTLSFTRLGAFALAHAGLSAALVSLAELPASLIATVVIMLVGNLFITALEGLVVSIQTTRLVMFEFFRRFFEGTGRRFQPLTLDGHPGR